MSNQLGQPLYMRHVSKRYGTTRAVIEANIDIHPGEIHGLVGENGAGKSTLMHVLSGAESCDTGAIEVEGTPVRFATPADGIKAGIGMVRQQPALFNELTVLQNLLVGIRDARRRSRDIKSEAKELLQTYDLQIDLGAPVAELSETEKEFVALVGLRLIPLKLIILDEPTATFSKADEERYYQMIFDLKSCGMGVVFITHKVREMTDIADRVTVMRKGRCIYSGLVDERQEDEIRALLFGNGTPPDPVDEQPLSEKRTTFESESRSTSDEILRLDAVNLSRSRGETRLLADINLSVQPGDISVITGISEFGPKQLEAVCTGNTQPTSGTIILDGRPHSALSPAILRACGVGYIPADRNFLASSRTNRVWENLVLIRRKQIHPRGLLDDRRKQACTDELLKDAGVSVNPELTASSLSGGMLQRIVLSREIDAAKKLLILSEPFRGLDLPGKRLVAAKLHVLSGRGIGILCFISDIDDALSIARTITVLNHGRVVLVSPGPTYDRTMIEEHILGMEVRR